MAKRGRGMREARTRKWARPKQGSRDIAQPARPGANAGGSALFLKYGPLSLCEVGPPQRCGIAITACPAFFRLLRGIAEHRDGM